MGRGARGERGLAEAGGFRENGSLNLSASLPREGFPLAFFPLIGFLTGKETGAGFFAPLEGLGLGLEVLVFFCAISAGKDYSTNGLMTFPVHGVFGQHAARTARENLFPQDEVQ